jgi:hypothetical protein
MNLVRNVQIRTNLNGKPSDSLVDKKFHVVIVKRKMVIGNVTISTTVKINWSYSHNC